jgi:hypothetical protein
MELELTTTKYCWGVPQVTELETIHATAEQQQEEMERLLKKNNNE